MFIVSQDGTEIVPLHRLWLDLDPAGESCIHHNLDSDHPSHVVATYPTDNETKSVFNDFIYYLRRDETVYEFPQPRKEAQKP
jgi:hypothetical protein